MHWCIPVPAARWQRGVTEASLAEVERCRERDSETESEARSERRERERERDRERERQRVSERQMHGVTERGRERAREVRRDRDRLPGRSLSPKRHQAQIKKCTTSKSPQSHTT